MSSHSRKVTIYQMGLVTCRDKQGRQTPSLQGYFADVVGTVKQRLDPTDVLWVINEETSERRVTFAEWLDYGEQIVAKGIKFKEQPIDDLTLQRMRLEKGVVRDDSPAGNSAGSPDDSEA